MGKRELLLIAGFIMVGTVVYFATAPEPAPGERGFSIGRIVDQIRREVRGNPGNAEVTSTSTIPLKSTVTELRLEPATATMFVIGEDRADLGCELLVWSNGADDAEARKYAGETKLKTTEAGATLALGVAYPEPAQQRATLTVRVPKTLLVRVQPSRGKVDISDVANLELVESRGQVTVRRVNGRLVATHRGGPLTIESVAELKLNTRGSNVTLKDVRGQAIVQMQAGELRGSAIAGPLEIETNNTRVMLDHLMAAQKPLRFTTVGGSATINGVANDLRVDARDTRLDVWIDKPAPITIYTEGDDPLTVTLPERGYELEALGIDSKVTVPSGLPALKIDGNESRASGRIGGGGPTITLRASRADLILKVKEPGATPPAAWQPTTPGIVPSEPPAPPAPAPPKPPR